MREQQNAAEEGLSPNVIVRITARSGTLIFRSTRSLEGDSPNNEELRRLDIQRTSDRSSFYGGSVHDDEKAIRLSVLGPGISGGQGRLFNNSMFDVLQGKW